MRLKMLSQGLQNMHQHVAAFVRFQFQQLFLFQRAQHVREAPQADLPFGEVGIIRLHRRFENGGFTRSKPSSLYSERMREKMRV